MGLGKYHAKRKFDTTPEPKGKEAKSSSKKLTFVIQEHKASQLHYDFRLELDGVLKSWAVPKGPSMDPHERHLAVKVEDHPLEYGKFEGTIPEGNYGAGEVIIWDKGTYYPRKETKNAEKTLRQELKEGHLTFILEGEKLHGEFALIKMGHAKEKNAWLLIKKGDEFASSEDITKKNESVVSHKTIETREVELKAYPKKPLPERIIPMLATLVDAPFSDNHWLFEIKWDGYRAIGARRGGEVQLYSRNNLDFRERYSPIAEALHGLPPETIVDGEIVVVDKKGKPHFELLQNWRSSPQGELCYFVFDMPWFRGRDIRAMPLAERKKLLKKALPKHKSIFFSDHVEVFGEKLFKEIQRQGLEGVMAKRADSPYKDDLRSKHWLKIKTHLRQETVIGGFTEPRGGRKFLGSLLLGVYDGKNLVYVGHSGGGIPDDQRQELRKALDKRKRKTSPFSEKVKPNAPVHWVEPHLVAEAEFSEWTKEGYMRHPEFKGLRPDKNPKSVHREKSEKPKNVLKNGKKLGAAKTSQVEFSHLDKVFWPELGYTKGDLVKYYETVGDVMLKYLKDRPHSLNRHPHGIGGESFYQKNLEHPPSWIKTTPIFSESTDETIHFLTATNLDSLLYMVQLGCIEINPWNSRAKHPEKPDWLVIDLDPEGSIEFKDVVTVAKTVHEICEEWKVPNYPKTSGKTGIHIYIPLGAKYNYDQAKQFAQLIAIETNKRQPKITSVERMPKARKNKIYVDFLQNRRGQTLAAPYSVRPTKEASVSTPLHWDEVNNKLTPGAFTMRNMPTRLKRVGDLWEPVLGKGINLASILKRLS